jgi:hypothetical protein
VAACDIITDMDINIPGSATPQYGPFLPSSPHNTVELIEVLDNNGDLFLSKPNVEQASQSRSSSPNHHQYQPASNLNTRGSQVHHLMQQANPNSHQVVVQPSGSHLSFMSSLLDEIEQEAKEEEEHNYQDALPTPLSLVSEFERHPETLSPQVGQPRGTRRALRKYQVVTKGKTVATLIHELRIHPHDKTQRTRQMDQALNLAPSIPPNFFPDCLGSS